MRMRQTIFSLIFAAVGSGSLATAQANPVPLVNNPLMPVGVAPGTGQFTLTVNGTGFVPASVVDWNDSPRATIFVNSSRLTAVITTADVAAAGTASVTVVNPAPGGGKSNVVFFPVTVPRSTVALALKASYGNGSSAGAFGMGDFNGDGKLDLVVNGLRNGVAAVQTLLGNGDGTFQAPAGTLDEGCCVVLATGDFNNDGNLDVALVTGVLTGATTVFLGNGDGTFGAPLTLPGHESAISIAVADFNGDGNLDGCGPHAGHFFENLIKQAVERCPKW
jgi:hypothetical protein